VISVRKGKMHEIHEGYKCSVQISCVAITILDHDLLFKCLYRLVDQRTCITARFRLFRSTSFLWSGGAVDDATVGGV
jgi:hypothetical protein